MGVVLVEPILCDALGRVWVISLVRWIDPFVCPLAERICEGINFPSKEACTSSLHEIVFVGDVTRQLCTFSGRRVMPMSKRMRHNRSANNVGDSIVEQSVGSSQAIVEQSVGSGQTIVEKRVGRGQAIVQQSVGSGESVDPSIESQPIVERSREQPVVPITIRSQIVISEVVERRCGNADWLIIVIVVERVEGLSDL